MMFLNLVLLLLGFAEKSISRVMPRSDGSDWSYGGNNGPDHWEGVCQVGSKQSPIDLVAAHTILHHYGTPLVIKDEGKGTWTKSWNGHAYVASLRESGPSSLLTGGSLGGSYIFQSLHIHWPSEHTVEGKRYTGEVHAVHYNSKYSYEQALGQPDGLAVVGILLEESDEATNGDFSKFVEAVASETQEEGDIGPYSLKSILPEILEPWARYEGSLTTPGCTENVQWTVLLTPIRIQRGIVQNDKHNQSNSYRPVQNLNGRIILHHSSAPSFLHPMTNQLGPLVIAIVICHQLL